jgi:3-phenylpropionate/trans-cinnamate dioxygenase ferredoxin subunit
MSSWHVVGRRQDVDEDQPLSAKIGDQEVGVYLVDGRLYALEDVCPHAYALLSQGFIDGDTIECPLHQAIFSIPTGRCEEGPSPRDVKVYAVKEENGDILVNLGGEAS